MKNQTIKQYSNMIDYCTLKLKEDWDNGAVPSKIIGLAEEFGLDELVKEFKQDLKDEKELNKSIEDYHTPTELKSFGGR